MFIDEYGNEFETVKEIEDFARKDFYKDKSELAENIELYFTATELVKWVLENDKEKFIKDFENVFKDAEDDYINNYFIVHDIEEI